MSTTPARHVFAARRQRRDPSRSRHDARLAASIRVEVAVRRHLEMR